MENKRTYIRRKRCLNEIVTQIKSTLVYISTQNGQAPDIKEVEQIALKHSNDIEAACWFPKQHLTEKEYQNLLMGKAQLLCQALISSHLPNHKQTSASPVAQQQQGFSDPETYEKPLSETRFTSCSPMTASELSEFLRKGTFSFSAITENTLPPFIVRSQKTTSLLI